MNFPERLREQRIKKGLSQSELAKRVHIHHSLIGRYETKGVQPSAEVLANLAEALEVTVDFLASGTTNEKIENFGDTKLITQFKKLAKLPKAEKDKVSEFIEIFLILNQKEEKTQRA